MERLTERLENGVINVKYASQHETAIHRLTAIEDILGDTYDIDRLRELVEADREGRCVVRMCKTGDKIYVVGNGKIVEAEIHDMYLLEQSKDIEFLVFFDCDDDCSGCPFNSWRQDHDGEWSCDGEYGDGSVKQSDIGKNVFLSRESAEEALKERERNAD